MNYVVAGGFVLAALIGVLVTLFAIAGRTGPTDPYHVQYRNVSGLRPGTPVHYEGYRVGQIERIVPEHSAQGTAYRVDIAIARGWPVREGSVARAASSGLISAPVIDIDAGEGRRTLAPGAEIAGEGRIDLFAALTDAANDFRTLSRESLRPLAASLEREVDALMTDLRTIAAEGVRPLVVDLRALTGRASQVARIDS